eukprot:scaffold36317_cov177-Isochrysis_galbana.AAC.5
MTQTACPIEEEMKMQGRPPIHTPQPCWGVAQGWPTKHHMQTSPKKRLHLKLQTHGGRPSCEEWALNPNSAWHKPFTSWDLQEAFK